MSLVWDGNASQCGIRVIKKKKEGKGSGSGVLGEKGTELRAEKEKGPRGASGGRILPSVG